MRQIGRPVFAAIERSLFGGRWATVEQLAEETGFNYESVRSALNQHPLADWRPVHGLGQGCGAPVKEWTLQVLKAKRRHQLDPDHFRGVRKMGYADKISVNGGTITGGITGTIQMKEGEACE